MSKSVLTGPLCTISASTLVYQHTPPNRKRQIDSTTEAATD